MNYNKKTNFLITNSIIVLFVLLISMLVNFYLTSLIGFNKDTYSVITISVLVVGLILYLLLSKSIFDPIFKSDENLQKTVKETLHELNIPISTIQLNTQMLEKKIDDEKALKRLGRIKKASNELLKLYEDMEYHIKKEIDRVDKTQFYLEDIVAHSLDKFEDMKNDINIEVDITNYSLNTDQNGFQKMLDNLISNALKYNLAQNGLIKIYTDEKSFVVFNSGKEIDTKNLFVIFDKFFQEDASKEGFGLGLFMVKEFCDKNRIGIKIEPKNEGNYFILNFKNIIKE